MACSISKALTKSRRLLDARPNANPCIGSVTPFIRQIAPHAVLLSNYFSNSAATTAVDGASPTSSPHHQENQRGVLAKLFLFVPGAIAFGLGTWQIFRREDKIKMLDYRKERLQMEPVKFDSVSAGDNVDSLEFRRVVCRGVFDEAKSVFIGPRSRSISGVTENGFYVITPLMPVPGDPESFTTVSMGKHGLLYATHSLLADGICFSVQSPVLVNRGWVPRNWRDKSLDFSHDGKGADAISHPARQGEISWWRLWSKNSKKNKEQAYEPRPIEVIGVVRGSEKPSIFVPANDPSSGQWFYVDVPAIARASGLSENTIYVEDINANVNPSNPYPIPKDVDTLIRSSVMPQDHLNYMLTWYSLSGAVTFMAYKRLKPIKYRR